MTHRLLVQIAARWLSATRGCSLVLTEFVCAGATETPDAIGWRISQGWSILVECKTSRADFRADAAKLSRTSREHSIGQERWYLTQPGLLRAEEIPQDWGLLETGAKICVVVRCPAGPVVGDRCPRGLIDRRVQANELPFLLSVYRRKECVKCGRQMFGGADAGAADELAGEAAAQLAIPAPAEPPA